MSMQIKKISADLLNDWLYFFDRIAFCDNGDWEGFYCMRYHWNKSLHQEKSWDCSKAGAPYNRKCAIDFIQNGKMQGCMAFENGKVIGKYVKDNPALWADFNIGGIENKLYSKRMELYYKQVVS